LTILIPVLDLLSKPIFIAFILWSMRNIEFDRFGFMSFKASESSAAVAPENVGDHRVSSSPPQ
jgi:bacteriorhodopsin